MECMQVNWQHTTEYRTTGYSVAAARAIGSPVAAA
jgi:hypothetical protein